ncbi:MAG TPA: type IX secretion system membrane protein PorP/SprF [Saprospiraceae bacterium]|nr:type IX secretion system membrane protein PorP/SprF [Saprospiraceae bacterium]HMQ82996.1 type IX secretion system membrane protein PorP/SprF [Saprospiraceae bacterium]
MKHIYLLGLILLFPLFAFSQQEDQFTQFMHYKLGFNPAYAGSTGGTRITAMGRQQWIGIEGAPQTQLITFNMAALDSKKLGIGASLIRSTIGVSSRYTLEGNYVYRFELGNGYLGLGLSASVRMLQANFSQLTATDPIDTDSAIPTGIQSRFVPNFGAGFYYNTQNFYLGFSAPRLLTNSIDLAESGDVLSREVPHFYGMTGFVIRIKEEDIKMQPHLLLKYVQGAPFDADFNLSFTFMNKFTTGVSYRIGGSKSTSIGEAISALVSAQVSNNILLGLAYDITLSDLKEYNSGSAEVFIHYIIGGEPEGEIFENPRFFSSNPNKGFY